MEEQARVTEREPGDVTQEDGRGDAMATRSLRGAFAAAAKRLDHVRLEYVYLVIALVFGVALIALMPPFQSPDEPSHFYRAWGLAEGRVFPPRDFTEDLPANAWALKTEFPVGEINVPGRYEGYSPDKVFRLLGEPISDQTVSVYSAIPSQNPVGYLPQAFGIEVARATGWSPLGAFYLARLFNLLVAVALVFIAIRIAPFGKTMFLIVAIFPVTVAEMASTSPDALMISGAMLFTALILHYGERARLGRREMTILLLVAAALLSVKPGYFALAGLLFLIPLRSLGSRRRWAAWIFGILAVVLVIAGLMALAPPEATIAVARKVGPVVEGADSMAQLRFVLGHPFSFVDALFNAMGMQAIDLGYWMTGMLSWFTIRVSHLATLALLGLTLLLIGGVDGEPVVGARRRTVLLSTWGLSTVVMCLALYMTTPVGIPNIYGLQGRYFTPMLPLLLLGLYRIRLRRQSLVILLIALALGVVILTTLRAVWFHYY
jgi:uncharacterized membrane protein